VLQRHIARVAEW